MTVSVVYFLEDRAQEEFVTSLVTRVGAEEGCSVGHRVLSAAGGSQVLKQLERFVTRLTDRPEAAGACDILIVAVDANCSTMARKVRAIRGIVQGTGLESRTVCCVTDPHI